jgi:hypothetical protein
VLLTEAVNSSVAAATVSTLLEARLEAAAAAAVWRAVSVLLSLIDDDKCCMSRAAIATAWTMLATLCSKPVASRCLAASRS